MRMEIIFNVKQQMKTRGAIEQAKYNTFTTCRT